MKPLRKEKMTMRVTITTSDFKTAVSSVCNSALPVYGITGDDLTAVKTILESFSDAVTDYYSIYNLHYMGMWDAANDAKTWGSGVWRNRLNRNVSRILALMKDNKASILSQFNSIKKSHSKDNTTTYNVTDTRNLAGSDARTDNLKQEITTDTSTEISPITASPTGGINTPNSKGYNKATTENTGTLGHATTDTGTIAKTGTVGDDENGNEDVISTSPEYSEFFDRILAKFPNIYEIMSAAFLSVVDEYNKMY